MTGPEIDPAELTALKVSVKDELRRRHRAVRGALPAAAREARSGAICAAVQRLPEWSRASIVLSFVSMRREVQTQGLNEARWSEGKRLATTRMTDSFDDLELRLWEPETQLEESGMGFLQPPTSTPRVESADIDLVIVPALAVDGRGHRIGYGRGFYDRLLRRMSHALRVAVLFDFERVPEVPTREEDEPVDVLVTDQRVERFER